VIGVIQVEASGASARKRLVRTPDVGVDVAPIASSELSETLTNIAPCVGIFNDGASACAAISNSPDDGEQRSQGEEGCPAHRVSSLDLLDLLFLLCCC